MRLSFLPGDLHLISQADRAYEVSFRGEVVLRTSSKKKALERYHEIRRQLETAFPPKEVPAEEKARRFERDILDNMVGRNSLRPPRKKPGRTRTFG